MSKTTATLVYGLVLLGLLLLTPSSGFSDDAKKEKPADSSVNKLKDNVKIKFDQEKARAHMGELEERMYRLSKLIQKTQPDDASRLLMGVRKAREHLIADRMKEATELLDSLKLEKALKQEQVIITHLEELKKLLLTVDISLELKLEQLRKLIKTRETLAKLVLKERRQLSNTQKLSENKSPMKKNFEALKSSEQRNQKSAENIEQFVREFGAPSSGICKALSSAGKCMGEASKNLGNSQSKPASKKQQDAIKKLTKAEVDLKKLEEKLKKEIEALVRQRVMDNIQDMITQQKLVRETTTKLIPRVSSRHKQAILATRRLAVNENRISDLCGESIELCELTKFSLVLPVALGVVQEQMELVSVELNAGRASDDLVINQHQIEKDLQSLLDAMKEASRPVSSKGGGQCKGCKGNRNKLLAEVKMLRWMQHALQIRTDKTDRLIDQNKLEKNGKQKSLKLLISRQTEIDNITNRLHTMTCPHCIQGE